MGLSIMDLHIAEADPLTTTEEGAILAEAHSAMAVAEAILVVAHSEMVVEEATLVEAHSEVAVVEVKPAEAHSALAVAEATVVEVPLEPEVTGAEARAAATAEEAVVSAEAVKMRTSAFIIRCTSRIGQRA